MTKVHDSRKPTVTVEPSTRRQEDEAPARPSPTGVAEAVQLLADRSAQVQRIAALQLDADAGREGGDLHRVAEAGVSGSGRALPHLDTIQRAFGPHEVGHIQAYTGGAAQRANDELQARAYATGSKVAFSEAPSLHTAAHEAAHVIQQQAGVQLEGGMGAVGDVHERHADAVADRVVAGRSAADLLDRYATPGSSPAPVQAKAVQRLPVVPEITVDEEKAILDYKSDNYKYFNWYLRGQQLTTSKVRSYGRTKVPQLRSALATMVQYRKYRHTGSLYRGDVFDNYSTSDQAQMSQARGQLTIPSFMSTTKSKSVAKGYGTGFWKISSNRSGVDIHAAGLGQEQEQEVLFPPDCTFQVETTKRDVKTGLFSSKPKLTVRQV